MKVKCEILSVEVKEGVSHKSGVAKPYSIRKAHCVLYLPEGKQVGLVQIPREMEKVPAPGLYEMEFGIKVDFQSHDVSGQVVNFVPVKAS